MASWQRWEGVDGPTSYRVTHAEREVPLRQGPAVASISVSLIEKIHARSQQQAETSTGTRYW
jgi:hypothetical protein